MAEQMGAVANEKLDFSNDVSVQTEEKTWTITRAEVTEAENGQGTFLSVDFQDESTPFPREERFWLKHNEVAGKKIAQMVQIARANAKRLYVAALGTKDGYPSDLVGKKVVATISEDDRGFAHLKNYKPAAAAEAIS